MTYLTLMAVVALDHSDELRFPHDANFLAFRDKLFGAAMLAAFAVTREEVQILIPDDQERGLFGDIFLHADPGVGGGFRGVCSREGEFSGEASNVAVQWAFGVAFGCNAGFKVVFVSFFPFGDDLGEGFSCLFFCHEDNGCGGAGVLFCVVVSKFKPEFFFEICQAVPALFFELRPCFSRDLDAVDPLGVEFGQVIRAASHFKGFGVKVAMLNERVPLQYGAGVFHELREGRLVCHVGGVDPVKFYVGGVEGTFGVYEVAGGEDCAIVFHHGQSNLADTVLLGVGRFNINRDKAVVALKEILFWFGRVAGFLNMLRGQGFFWFGRSLRFSEKFLKQANHGYLTLGFLGGLQSVIGRNCINSPHTPHVNEGQVA